MRARRAFQAEGTECVDGEREDGTEELGSVGQRLGVVV